ncbi:DUF5518 domain-containing protein [Haloarcula litorea]|uniref:DUF5518 domain-containing protein n=1 Tax=Haloarcula litorea TaxID=3032579 RepID=UPI0023E77DEB|nr:DUF5518 domain-containing protein [Halomicroarcula sp. GDY20]
MSETGPLSQSGKTQWKDALVGGLLALPGTALAAWRSPESISLGTVVVGSAIADSLIKRRGGNGTATGLRAALIGGFPAVWALKGLVWALPTIPNPPWFQAVGVVVTLTVGGVILLVVAVCGALAGRVGGWLAEQRGHGGVADAGGSVDTT